MPSSWSIKLAGTCRPASSCRQTLPSLRCRQNAPSSIRSKMSGSSCATTGSRTASSNPTTISSTIAATLGTSWSISPGASCPLDCANGRTGSDQGELVLFGRDHRFHGARRGRLHQLPRLQAGPAARRLTDHCLRGHRLHKGHRDNTHRRRWADRVELRRAFLLQTLRIGRLPLFVTLRACGPVAICLPSCPTPLWRRPFDREIEFAVYGI